MKDVASDDIGSVDVIQHPIMLECQRNVPLGIFNAPCARKTISKGLWWNDARCDSYRFGSMSRGSQDLKDAGNPSASVLSGSPVSTLELLSGSETVLLDSNLLPLRVCGSASDFFLTYVAREGNVCTAFIPSSFCQKAYFPTRAHSVAWHMTRSAIVDPKHT